MHAERQRGSKTKASLPTPVYGMRTKARLRVNEGVVASEDRLHRQTDPTSDDHQPCQISRRPAAQLWSHLG